LAGRWQRLLVLVVKRVALKCWLVLHPHPHPQRSHHYRCWLVAVLVLLELRLLQSPGNTTHQLRPCMASCGHKEALFPVPVGGTAPCCERTVRQLNPTRRQ
jgi:hypothetical protein